MRRYPAYRDSGVEWLGEVPEGWEVSPFRQLVARIESGTSVNATDTPALDGEVAVLKTSCVYGGDFDPAENKIVVPEEVERVTCPLRADALIVSRMNTPDLVGAAGHVREVMPNLYLPDRLWQISFARLATRFAYYFTRSPLYRDQVRIACAGTSSSMQNLAQDDFKAFWVPLPSLPEQTAIAAFLDRETAKIDALVAEQRRLIALLAEKRQAVISHAVTRGLDPTTPLKPSGIDWLSDVPEGWEVVRLGALFRQVAESGHEGLPILSISIHSGVSDGELSEEEMDRKVTRSEDRTKYLAVKPGDLAYNMMRAWQGGFGAVGVDGMVSPAYVVARPIKSGEVCTRFVELLLRTGNAVEEMKRHSRGVTDFRLRLYWDEFKNVRVAIPSAAEQSEILAHIDGETTAFDSLITTAESAIALLQERRAALISAAVTGKIDVRDLADTATEAA